MELEQPISSIFNFISDTSQLFVVDVVLNREILDTYVFEVMATDSKNAQATATVNITLSDVNDNAPVITTPP